MGTMLDPNLDHGVRAVGASGGLGVGGGDGTGAQGGVSIPAKNLLHKSYKTKVAEEICICLNTKYIFFH